MHTLPVQRRYDLDWLRILAVFAVFIYHGTLIFAPDPYQIKNSTLYPYLDDLGALGGLWGMPLMLIISGASVYHALGKYRPGKYVLGIVLRLLVPLVVGIFTHAAFQVYLENLHKGTFSGSFLEFYPHYFQGMYGFGGNFAWMGMHLWYLEFLFVFSMLCLPLYLWLKLRPSGQRLLRRLGDLLSWRGTVYLIAIPTIIIYNLFDPDGLGTTVIGGWSIFNYLGFFISGFVLISNARLQASTVRMRWISLLGGIILWGLIDPIWEALGDPSFGTLQFVIGVTVWCLCAWCWLLAILGFAFKHLNRTSPTLRYANEAVLPFYIMHQSVLLPIAFFVVRWAIPDLLKFLVIIGATFAIVMGLYEYVVRRFNGLRFLFGMKPSSPRTSAQPRLVEPAGTV